MSLCVVPILFDHRDDDCSDSDFSSLTVTGDLSGRLRKCRDGVYRGTPMLKLSLSTTRFQLTMNGNDSPRVLHERHLSREQALELAGALTKWANGYPNDYPMYQEMRPEGPDLVPMTCDPVPEE